MFFDEQIALLNKEVTPKEAAFRLLTEEFLKNECVTEAYLDNVIKRGGFSHRSDDQWDWRGDSSYR